MNDTRVTAYPNREHKNADGTARERAEAALNCIEGEVMIIRRRIADGADASHDVQILADAVRRLTHTLAVLETLRDVREWHAADQAEEAAR